MSFKLKYVLYKANKLMMVYSYVITSLPEAAQVYNNTTMSFFYSSSLFYWLVGTRGAAARCFRFPTRVSGTLVLVELKRMALPLPGWSRPQASSVGSQLMAFPADMSMAYPVQVLSHLHTG